MISICLCVLKKATALNILRMTPTGSNVYRTNYNTIHTTPSGSHTFFVNQFSINMLSLRDKTITQILKTPALGDSTNVGVRKQITNLATNCSKKYKPRNLI
jgi:hypothetical protein